MRYVLVLGALMSLITGCTVSPITPMDLTEQTVIDIPEIDRVMTNNLGETLVARGVRTTGKALEISKVTKFNKQPGERSLFMCGLSVAPASQFYRGRWQTEREIADCYGPFNIQVTAADGAITGGCPGTYLVNDICQDQFSHDFFIPLGSYKALLKQDFGNISVVEKVVSSRTNFVQEFIYNGRSGNTVKFIYRELSDDMLRAAFSQEVQYDLSQSTEVGFKSLRIEIIEASNTSITYKMLSNF